MRKHTPRSCSLGTDFPVRIGQSFKILGQFAISTDAQIVDKLHPVQGLFLGEHAHLPDIHEFDERLNLIFVFPVFHDNSHVLQKF